MTRKLRVLLAAVPEIKDMISFFACLTDTELGPSRYFQQVLHDSSILVAGKLSTQSQCPKAIYDCPGALLMSF